MELLLRAVADALEDALDDVHAAQALMKQGERDAGEPNARQVIEQLLQSVENNLMDTAIGLRLIKNQDASHEKSDGNTHSAPG